MRSNPILMVLSAAAIGLLVGVSSPIRIAPTVLPLFSSLGGGGGGGGDDANCTSAGAGGRNMAARLSAALPFFGNSTTSTATPMKVSPPAKSEEAKKGAERLLPPDIVVRESDLHLRRLWGQPREDTPVRKYLVALTVGYSERANVNATVHKFSDNFDVMLFHYDGRTTEWDAEFEWSRQAIHVSARKQAKWWYAKRFMHPSVVAPYEYVFLWDQDLGAETFDAEEYIRVARKHGLEISQPGLDIVRGVKNYDVNVRRNDTEVHTSTSAGRCSAQDAARRPPCSAFVEVMAPVFTRRAWACVWHMIQNDLVHGWGLDWNFWRCVDEPGRQMGVVDAQYVAHHHGFTLGDKGNDTVDGSRRKVRLRASAEFGEFKARLYNADRAQQAAAALLAQSKAAAAAAPPPS
ncbi:uncharacterized protein [Zea mays]|uniref:Storage protein-like n=1 Tax=Zea mays TaxID=4577 RepID=K7TYZ5_MAIZE|nr:uncharacterized protein LOC103653353 isoform X2 [Zea mays]AQK52017.1 Storage protein-like [Zea mays]|eukprot:XP_008678503.2 uncharacterized protein LOC103653353 isoform X2 [Zea mays]